jgi:hypothetical protein
MHSVEIPILSPVRGYIRSSLSFWFMVEIRGLSSLEVDRPAFVVLEPHIAHQPISTSSPSI